MTAVDQLAQPLEQNVDLGRRQVGVRVVYQPSVQAQLAQQGQRAERRVTADQFAVCAQVFLPLT